MAALRLHLKGYITEDGELKITLPEGYPTGEVEVTIAASAAVEEEPPETTWTDEEIEAMIHPNPKSGQEIAQNSAIGSWAQLGITDSLAWVEEQRRKRKEKRGW